MMKKALSVFLLVFVALSGGAQNMQIKKANLTGFAWAKKIVTPLLDKLSSDSAKKHPEYGIIPYNAQCTECVELIDKRTVFTRSYVDPQVPSHIFSQQSYFALHYKKSPGDILRTIDPRLRPDSTKPGVYSALDQPVPTSCDLNKKTACITVGGLNFEFDKGLTLYYSDDSSVMSKPEIGNYNNYTIGEQGLAVKNMWPGIDMQQVYRTGEVKTSYIIRNPLQIPITNGYLIIEDHFSLPDDSYSVTEASNGEHIEHSGFRGNYYIKDKHGNILITYARPVYIDVKAVGIHGIYHLIKDNNNYTLQTLVPVKWLNRSENVYPLTVDPLVQPGDSAWGNFASTSLPSANLAFTSIALGSCDYHMSISVPGMSTLLNTLVNIEYQLTFSDSCGSPPEPFPYCLFSQVKQTVLADHCNMPVTFGCSNLGDTTGYCTTDSFTRDNIFHTFSPDSFSYTQFLPCYPPQCPNYDIPFTLKNTDSICGDLCGYLCARGTTWEMTVEACTVNGSITQNKTKVCAGQTATFTADPNCGVPPYHYVWSADGGNTLDTIYGTPNFVVTTSDTISSPDSVFVFCYVFDSCQNYAVTNSLQLNIIPKPRADAGPDIKMCLGGTATIGGSPTTNNSASTSWSGSRPTVQSWLNSTSSANPAISVPFGTIDTFFYAVTTDDQTCLNTDTVYVYSVAGEKITIDSLTAIRVCAGVTVKLITEGGPFQSYLWNNGTADSLLSTTNPGPYYVVVKDSAGCLDTSNTLTVTNFGPPSVAIYPDTTILSGDSVQLYSDVNLFSASIDSFFWYPMAGISCITCASPIVAPLSDATYGLTIYSHGCQVSAKVLIQVIQPDNFFIPNVFTPNGDGNNDQFYIQYQTGVTVLQFQVFDRWGEKVHDGMYPWDGNYKGKPCQPGVYVYIFKLQLYGRQLATMRKGSVTLLK